MERDSAFYITTLGPSTPLKPAIQSMLALIPSHLALIPSQVTDPAGTSAYYASRASHAIDTTLADGPPSLDVIQAIYLLSVWDWAQNGKPSESRTLAVQALQLCMEMGLHRLDQGALAFSIDTTWYKDSCRRTWWACFTLHTMLSILATTDPMIELSDQRLCAAYPVTSPDGRGWKEYVEAINRCAIVTNQLGQVHSHKDQPNAEFEASIRRLQRLAHDMQHILAIEPSRQSGIDGANTLDFTARLGLSTSIIYLHRQQAFSNIAVFSRDTCGLQRAMPTGDNGSSGGTALGSLEEGSVEATELFDSFIDTGALEDEGASIAGDLALSNAAGSSSSALALKRSGQLSQAFAPAVSMQRCAMAASDVAQNFIHLRQQATSRWVSFSASLRLSLTRSVVISPLCACGLATAVYDDILFALMVYSDQPADAGMILQGKIGEIASIQQALREAGSIWSTVRVIAGESRIGARRGEKLTIDEVQAALEALIGIISAGNAGLTVAAG